MHVTTENVKMTVVALAGAYVGAHVYRATLKFRLKKALEQTLMDTPEEYLDVIKPFMNTLTNSMNR